MLNCPETTERFVSIKNFIFHVCFFLIFLFSLASHKGRAPQQREPITVGLYYLSQTVNFPCWRKPEYPEKTRDYRQSVILFSHEDWIQVHLTGDRTRNLRGERKKCCYSHLEQFKVQFSLRAKVQLYIFRLIT